MWLNPKVSVLLRKRRLFFTLGLRWEHCERLSLYVLSNWTLCGDVLWLNVFPWTRKHLGKCLEKGWPGFRYKNPSISNSILKIYIYLFGGWIFFGSFMTTSNRGFRIDFLKVDQNIIINAKLYIISYCGCPIRLYNAVFILSGRQKLLVSPHTFYDFFEGIFESSLTLSITVWYGNTMADDRKRLNRV